MRPHSGRRLSPARLAFLVLLAAPALAACGDRQETSGEVSPGPDVDQNAALIENGRAIAEAQCAGCHAIGAADQSPRSDAPPLRTVLASYDPDALADSFREGIHVGHPDMPDFDLGPKGVDSVLAYLRSINAAD